MGSSISYLLDYIGLNGEEVDSNEPQVLLQSPKDDYFESEPDEMFTHHMENMADDYMKQSAFSRTAEMYGLHDDFISDDLPLEEFHSDYDLNSDDIDGSLDDDHLIYNENSMNSNNSVARWRKGVLLGSGSFGTVFLAVNLDNGRLFAVKQVELKHFQISKHEVEVQSLHHEISVLRTLQHKNIVQYLGSNVEDNTINIFLEYVPGGSILSLTKKFGHLPENIIKLYTNQILDGLVYLHKHNIVHRDIKGANILVTDKGVIKLADFGASKNIENLITHASGSEGVNSLKGTTYWMAPEVIKQNSCDIKADIWSLGCTVIEMATGKPPWIDEFSEQISAMFTIATSNDPPPIPSFLSSDAKDFLMKCFIRDPTLRPSSEELLSHPWINKDISMNMNDLNINDEILDEYV